jgi:hypothetical protein
MKAMIAKKVAITRPNERLDGCFAAAVRSAELTLLATLFPPPYCDGGGIETITQPLAQRLER